MSVAINFSPDGLTAFGRLNDSSIKLSWVSKDQVPSMDKLQEIFAKALDSRNKVGFKYKAFELPLSRQLRLVHAKLSDGSDAAVLWLGCASFTVPLNYAIPDFKSIKVMRNNHFRLGLAGRMNAYWAEVRRD